jgi:heme exporter protein CcmD
MSYVIASYGVTILALGGYALSLYNEHRRLRAELATSSGNVSAERESGAPDGR